MSGVDHQRVDPGPHEQLDALLGALAHAHGGADTQLAHGVACGVGEVGLLGDVLHRHQAAQLEVVGQHQHALQAVLVHERLALVEAGALLHPHQALAGCHHLAHRRVQAGLEAQVAVGDDAHHPLALEHREAREAVLARQRDYLAHRRVGRHGDGVAQQTALVALDARHLGRLLPRREVLVHDADAAFLRNGNRQAGLRHGVHGRRDQRQIQRDVAGKLGREAGVARQHLGVGRHQQHIVEGERFAE